MDTNRRTKGLLLIGLILVTAVVWGLIAANRGALASTPGGQATGKVSPAAKIDPRVVRDTAHGQSTSVVIYLTDQADVSAAYNMKDEDARGWYVYNTLTSHAERTQAGLRAF